MTNLMIGGGLLLMTAGIVSAGVGGMVLVKGHKGMCNGLTLASMALVFTGAWLWSLS